MRYVLIAIGLLVSFWCGVAVQASVQPPPPVYIVKSDAPRCDLIDRFVKKNGRRL